MNMLRFRLMDEAPDPTGEGGGEATTVENTETATMLSEETPADNTAESEAADKTAEKPADKPASSTLLDDEPEKKPEEKEDDPPTEEDIKGFTDSLKAVDLGDGVKWDDEILAAMTPELMRLSGRDPKKAEGLVKAYTAHQQAMAKKFAEQQDKFNAGLIAQCKERFGADLQKVAKYAKIGGKTIFGDDIWNEMKKVPGFANNPEVLARLAEWGRKVAPDSGKIAPKDGGESADAGDVLHRMYGSVKV